MNWNNNFKDDKEIFNMVYFLKIEKIKYEGMNIKNMYVFWYYNLEEIIMGKIMKEYLWFVVVYWYIMI